MQTGLSKIFPRPKEASALLQTGCLDELSLVTVLVTGGDTGAASLFDRSRFLSGGNAAAFKLLELRQYDCGAVWMRLKTDR